MRTAALATLLPALAGCNLLTDFGVGFLPADGGADGDAHADDDAGFGADAGSPPATRCDVTRAATPLEGAPVGAYASVAATDEGVAVVAFVQDALPWFVTATCADGLSSEPRTVSEEFTADRGPTDIAYNRVTPRFGVSWSVGGAAAGFLELWPDGAGGFAPHEEDAPLLLTPEGAGPAHDTRWPRLATMSSDRLVLVLPDASSADGELRRTLFELPPGASPALVRYREWISSETGPVWPESLDIAGDVLGRSHVYAAWVVGPQSNLTTSVWLLGGGPSGSYLHEPRAEVARIAAIDDDRAIEDGDPAAVLAKDVVGALTVYYPDLPDRLDEAVPVVAARSALGLEVAAEGTDFAFAWTEKLEDGTLELRVSMIPLDAADPYDQETTALALSAVPPPGPDGRLGGPSIASLGSGEWMVVWSEPGPATDPVLRLACVACSPDP